MQVLIGLIFGYIIHDAVQPTAGGQLLDKMSLPSDFLVKDDTVRNL